MKNGHLKIKELCSEVNKLFLQNKDLCVRMVKGIEGLLGPLNLFDICQTLNDDGMCLAVCELDWNLTKILQNTDIHSNGSDILKALHRLYMFNNDRIEPLGNPYEDRYSYHLKKHYDPRRNYLIRDLFSFFPLKPASEDQEEFSYMLLEFFWLRILHAASKK